ncbi:MAG TPA: type II toxin-antitoxin system VapC family toxin [Anaeromyxobacteraceae bacterium]|nr:type II toxin-antitoxin system VapC family toxin [Anaeromyxobacteraceae bacterium]
MVVDTSAVLAMFFGEPSAAWVAGQLNEHARALRMSTVNLAEALIRIRDRQPQLADELEERLLASGIRFVPPDVRQAQLAARARLTYPLNLGDCFAYALAKVEDSVILTVDSDFRAVDCRVLTPT